MNAIKNCRLKVNMTQEALANELGLDSSTVAKWEAGDSLPRARLLPKIATILNCTIEELLTDPLCKREASL